MAIPDLDRTDVLDAIQRLDAGAPHPFGDPTAYLLLHQGKAYPPKAVIGLAIEAATGRSASPTDFSGGNEPVQANGVLRRLGFDVVSKTVGTPSSRWWALGTGEEGEAWSIFLEQSCIVHRGTGLGDLRQYSTREMLQKAVAERRDTPHQIAYATRVNWDTVHTVQVGDFVVARRGLSRMLGIGRVTGPYEFTRQESGPYRHRRPVLWLWCGDDLLPEGMQFRQDTLDDLSGVRAPIIWLAKARLRLAGFNPSDSPSDALRVGSMYTRPELRELLRVPGDKGGMWDTGYAQHMGEWYLFPNVGVPGRTGHDYDNRWEGERLRWFAKNRTRLTNPSVQAMLGDDAVVHLFTREDDRGAFTYHGHVRSAEVHDTTPVEVLWEVLPQPSAFLLPEEVPEGVRYREGAVRTVTVNAYERNSAARNACLARWGYACAACSVSMEDIYGEVAREHIHVHHLRSLAEVGDEYEVDPVNDLRPLCPNCHAVAHLRNPAFTIDEVRGFLRGRG